MTTGETPTPGWKPRIVTIAVVVLLLGVPAAVLAPVLSGKAIDHAYSGAQPGGLLCGVVRSLKDQQPLSGVLVDVRLARFEGVNERRRGAIGVPKETEWRKLRTDEAGEFELQVPEHEGIYVVRAGGETYASSVQWFSFLDRSREVRSDVPPLRFALAPGGRVLLKIDGAGPADRPRGHIELKRPPTFFGFGGGESIYETDFEGTRVETAVLPVQALELVVYFENGQAFSQWVDLQAGRNEVVLDLAASTATVSPDEESRPDPSRAPEDRSPSPSDNGR